MNASHRKFLFVPIACAVAAFSPYAASGAVQDATANGFTVSDTTEIAAPPDRVYETLAAPRRWWSSEHTYSHDAANLSLDPRAGGCWCEMLPGGGSVQHLVVVNAMPASLLRLRGALGPLQGMAVDGAMTVRLRGTANGTELTLTYAMGGYAKDGLAALAGAVDSVLAEQTARLKRLVETGSPETAQPSRKGD